jgi:hypothetical protein
MEVNKDIDFDNLHLFETSILGDFYFFSGLESNHLMITCYNPQFIDSKNDNLYSEKTYLIFKNVEYFVCINNLYDNKGENFINKAVTSKLIFEANYHSKLFKLSNLGVTESGKGWVSYTILALEFFIIADKIQMGHLEPDIIGKYNDTEILKFLVNPKSDTAIKILREIY